MFSKKRKTESNSEEIYYIHEFKRAHIEPLFDYRRAKHLKIASHSFKTCQYIHEKESALKPTESLKLFDMCLRFIASNLEYVDSLVGFPDQIGHLLYKGNY